MANRRQLQRNSYWYCYLDASLEYSTWRILPGSKYLVPPSFISTLMGHFGISTTPGLGDLQSPFLFTTYKSWDDPPTKDPSFNKTSLRPCWRPLGEFHHPDVPVPNAARAMRPRQNDRPLLKAGVQKGNKTVEIGFLLARSRFTVPFRTSRGALCAWCFFWQDLVDVGTPLNKWEVRRMGPLTDPWIYP